MMERKETLLTVFSATIDERNGTPVIQIPTRELDLGPLSTGETYRVALLDGPDSSDETADADASSTRPQNASSSAPPVAEGEQLDVEIEGVGEKGDGIARVGPGYVIFVPDTAVGDRVTIEVTQIRENFGFAEVLTPEPITG